MRPTRATSLVSEALRAAPSGDAWRAGEIRGALSYYGAGGFYVVCGRPGGDVERTRARLRESGRFAAGLWAYLVDVADDSGAGAFDLFDAATRLWPACTYLTKGAAGYEAVWEVARLLAVVHIARAERFGARLEREAFVIESAVRATGREAPALVRYRIAATLGGRASPTPLVE